MFEKLRLREAIKVSMMGGLLLLMVLVMFVTYSFISIAANIDRTLSDMKLNGYSEEENEKADDRNKLYIRIASNGDVTFSNNEFYTKEIADAIVKHIVENPSGNGRMRESGYHIAYAVQNDNPDVTIIYIYDYTVDAKSVRGILFISIIAGVVALVGIAFLSLKFAKMQVEPIEEAFNKQQELIANASHELKTPLTIINTDLTILNSTRDTMTEEQQKWVDGINVQVGRMSNLISEMLELAKIDSQPENVIKETVNLTEVTQSIVLASEALAFEKHCTIETDIAEDVKISAIGANIEKLIYILIDNALKYSNEGGVVTVSVIPERKKTILKVRNTGEGIPPEILPKLFDRFYRVDEAHSSPNSFGLGLAIAKSIVDANGGTISVESAVGEYTEFVVVFK